MLRNRVVVQFISRSLLFALIKTVIIDYQFDLNEKSKNQCKISTVRNSRCAQQAGFILNERNYVKAVAHNGYIHGATRHYRNRR